MMNWALSTFARHDRDESSSAPASEHPSSTLRGPAEPTPVVVWYGMVLWARPTLQRSRTNHHAQSPTRSTRRDTSAHFSSEPRPVSVSVSVSVLLPRLRPRISFSSSPARRPRECSCSSLLPLASPTLPQIRGRFPIRGAFQP